MKRNTLKLKPKKRVALSIFGQHTKISSVKKKMERKNEKYAFASAKYSEMIFFEVHTQNFKCFYVKKNPGIFISLE